MPAVTYIVIAWLSHPAAFVLGGAGLVLLRPYGSKQEHVRAIAITLSGCLWLGSFFAHVQFSSALGTDVTDIPQNRYWMNAFMPVPPNSGADVVWFWQAIVGIFDRPLAFEMAGFATLAAAAGGWQMWQRSPALVSMLLLPVLLTLLVSGLRLYPSTGRLLLFLGPALLLLISHSMVLFGAWA